MEKFGERTLSKVSIWNLFWKMVDIIKRDFKEIYIFDTILIGLKNV
jgi:hypothetical protein